MSTVKVTNLQHASSASPNIVLDSSGNATMAGSMAMATPFAMRNKIINGAMEIDQRNAGAVVSNIYGYFIDRWGSNYAGSARYSAQRSTVAPSGYINSMLLTVTTAASPASADYNNLYQAIEGFNIADLGWGSASAKTVTISFWVRCSVTGTYGFRLCNSNATRSYVATYTISAANTWEQKTITIPGDTTGTWATDNTAGIFAVWDLGHGSSFDTATPNTWVAGNYTRTSSCVILSTNSGATFYMTGVQLEVGSVATPFERRLYPQELAMCKRYWQKSFSASIVPANNTTPTSIVVGKYAGFQGISSNIYPTAIQPFEVSMRASPSLTFYQPNGSAGNAGGSGAFGDVGNSSTATYWTVAASTSSTEHMQVQPTSPVNAGNFIAIHWIANAEL